MTALRAGKGCNCQSVSIAVFSEYPLSLEPRRIYSICERIVACFCWVYAPAEGCIVVRSRALTVTAPRTVNPWYMQATKCCSATLMPSATNLHMANSICWWIQLSGETPAALAGGNTARSQLVQARIARPQGIGSTYVVHFLSLACCPIRSGIVSV